MVAIILVVNVKELSFQPHLNHHSLSQRKIAAMKTVFAKNILQVVEMCFGLLFLTLDGYAVTIYIAQDKSSKHIATKNSHEKVKIFFVAALLLKLKISYVLLLALPLFLRYGTKPSVTTTSPFS